MILLKYNHFYFLDVPKLKFVGGCVETLISIKGNFDTPSFSFMSLQGFFFNKSHAVG